MNWVKSVRTSSGPRTVPWDVEDVTGIEGDIWSSILTLGSPQGFGQGCTGFSLSCSDFDWDGSSFARGCSTLVVAAPPSLFSTINRNVDCSQVDRFKTKVSCQKSERINKSAETDRFTTGIMRQPLTEWKFRSNGSFRGRLHTIITRHLMWTKIAFGFRLLPDSTNGQGAVLD